MAQLVLTDCHVTLDGTDYSGQGTNVAISYSAEALDVTPFGEETRTHVGGTKEWSVAFEGNADESITGGLFDMVGEVVPIAVRASSAAVSEGNPSYEGSALVTDYQPLGGSHGEAHTFTLSLVSAGPLSRITVAA